MTVDRPDVGVDIPTNYRAGKGTAAPPTLDWWRGFRAPELTAFMEEAQRENFDIAAAVARIQQADALSKIAGAPLFPDVNFNGTATRTRSSQAGGSTGGSERVSYQAALSASYEIDFWGKNRAASLAAQQNAVAARFNSDVVVLATQVSVATDYFQVVLAQERLRVARENLKDSSRVLDLIKQRFDAGTASALDVAQQESLVATVRATIPPLDQSLRQSIAALAVLLGRAPVKVKVRGKKLYSVGLPRVTPGLPSEILLQRPDLRAAESSLLAADAAVDSARAALFPSITLTGDYGLVSSTLKNLFTPQAIFYNITAGLAQPVFDGFRLEGQLEAAQGRQMELLQDYRQAIVQSFSDVEQALIAVADNAERERLQRDVVSSSRRAFEIADQRLREGTIDQVTLLQTQQTLFQAEDTLALVRFARLQAVLSLFQALGGSWLPPAPAHVAKDITVQPQLPQ